MQMPIPPVSQCRKKQRARPDQENQAGTKARRARAWRAPIQMTGPQASRRRVRCAIVVVAMINL